MQYRIDTQGLLDTLAVWNGFLKRKTRLIACGGTAMTLLGVKPSTKDIDFLVPVDSEYDYLLKTLKDLGYKPVTGYGWAKDDGFIFDLFKGKKVFTTELLQSSLDDGQNIKVAELSRIYLGVLNYYDLIISKLFRGSSVDLEDCLLLLKNKRKEIKINTLVDKFKETASYDISEDKVNKNLVHFLKLAEKI
jgi:hypothetical protein